MSILLLLVVYSLFLVNISPMKWVDENQGEFFLFVQALMESVLKQILSSILKQVIPWFYDSYFLILSVHHTGSYTSRSKNKRVSYEMEQMKYSRRPILVVALSVSMPIV